MNFVRNRKFIILALVASLLTAIIELSTAESPRMVVYLPYGLIVPILILLPRISHRFSAELITKIEGLVFGIIVVCAPGSLWLHDMGIQYDRFLHFAVSFMSFILLMLILRNLYITIPILFIGLFAFEAYQYLVDVIFGTQLFYDAAQNIKVDVIEDIIFGIAGGALALYLYIKE